MPRALLTGAPPPEGFDEERLRVESAALRAKRGRVVAKLAPDECRRLGERFPDLFAEYARAHPRTEGVRAREDARAFVAWARRQGHLRRRWWR
ncbi:MULTISPECIES: hypothetical protein [Amycolatopsis]|uniref:SCO6045-like C-terminal domain-containing protein n=2 Tax=Amycolatopsis TaxID=1813 RepID=A0A1I3JRQ5_9PSEU|nr:hypothetical protein [Amycolatopsis sacchari]SFI62698.1 hypothetical protein SAMN05421835_101242 [Amycolatopsis sacchari]